MISYCIDRCSCW